MHAAWTPLRLARWGLVGSAAAVAVALSVTGYANYAAARAASTDVVRGQAVAFAESLHGAVRAARGRPTEADLESWLADHKEDGLRYAAVWGRVAISAGTPLGRAGRPRRRRPITEVRVGDRIRVVMMGRRRGRRRRHGLFGRLRRFRGPPPPRPGLVLEFEPVVADRLAARARRGLLVNSAVAVVLLALAGVAFRWLRGREEIDRIAAEKRHLASLGEMSAVLAHEIKNPLASLKGHAQLLAESLDDDARHGKAERVVSETVRLENLVRGLLEFVRTGDAHRAPCDPRQVVREAAESVAPGGVEVDTSEAPEHALLDADRVGQVVANLVANAAAVSGDAPVIVTAQSRKRDLIVRVRDGGPGLPDGDAERLFEPFFTTKTRGTGLGLAVARRIAEAHGGTLTAANHPTGGAVFTLTLPIGEDS